jgi:hypothetical protein
VALDGLAIFADDAEANDCDTVRYSGFMEVLDLNGVAGLDDGAGGACPTCVDGPDGDMVNDHYQFSDWRDVLRIVYGGQHAHATRGECLEGAPSRSNINQKFCNSDVRRTLVENWGNLFEEGTACGAADPDACVRLQHAFRRDDVSGTTDTFLELLALPAVSTGSIPSIVAQRTFCNGLEMEDDDPIRRNCAAASGPDGEEQTCQSVDFSLLGPKTPSGWYGGPTVNPATTTEADIGLVLAMVIPATNAYHDTRFCSAGPQGGSFRYASMPPGVGGAQQRCPDGNARVGGQCQWPALSDGAGGFTFGCINRKLNRPGARTIANMDGRVYNLIPRNVGGSMQTVTRVNPNTEVSGDVTLVNAMYRIHGTRVMVGGTPPSGETGCRLPDATEQIGCLVHASPCSIGFSGLAGDLIDPNKPLAMRTPLPSGGAVLPTPTNIRRLNDPVSTTATGCHDLGDYDERYPLSRPLWVNSVLGFEGADGLPRTFDNIPNTNRERDLIKCACDRHFADQSAAFAGFVTNSDLAPGECDTPGEGGICDVQIRTCP